MNMTLELHIFRLLCSIKLVYSSKERSLSLLFFAAKVVRGELLPCEPIGAVLHSIRSLSLSQIVHRTSKPKALPK